jgi:hypothetical protein
MILKLHPELKGKPKETARVLALLDPAFSGLSPGAVSKAETRLLKRLNGLPDPDRLCFDRRHIGMIVAASDGARVCQVCGRVHGQESEGPSASDQRAFTNPMLRVLETKGLVYPRGPGETMISQAATTVAAFGSGVAGRLTQKAMAAMEEICKGFPLPQDRTAELARLVEAESHRRSPYQKQATLEEARAVVISCLITLAGRDKVRSHVYLEMIRQATVFFVDLTKSTKRTKHSLIDEEEEAESHMARNSRGDALHVTEGTSLRP